MFVGQIERFENMRKRRIPTGDTLHGRLQTEEAFALDVDNNNNDIFSIMYEKTNLPE